MYKFSVKKLFTVIINSSYPQYPCNFIASSLHLQSIIRFILGRLRSNIHNIHSTADPKVSRDLHLNAPDYSVFQTISPSLPLVIVTIDPLPSSPEMIMRDNGLLNLVRIVPVIGRAPYFGVNPCLASTSLESSMILS